MYRYRNKLLKTNRDVALDITRGMCVFAMAVHHCINYFPDYSLTYWRFVSGAFPFLSGYLTTSILRERYIGIKAANMMGIKLLIRGCKLIVLCLVLNLAIQAILPEMTKLEAESLLEAVKVILFTGNYRNVSFSLLIPIGFVLLFSGFLCITTYPTTPSSRFNDRSLKYSDAID